MRAKLYPLERLAGSFRCNGKRYHVSMNVTESITYSRLVLWNFDSSLKQQLFENLTSEGHSVFLSRWLYSFFLSRWLDDP